MIFRRKSESPKPGEKSALGSSLTETARGVSGYLVSDLMSSNVRTVGPDDTVERATRLMREEDTGILPVGEGGRLVGVVTERDIALRLVAEGKDAARTKVRAVMSEGPNYVFEDEDLGRAAEHMVKQQVRRVPVVNRTERIVGVLSLEDVIKLQRGSRSKEQQGKRPAAATFITRTAGLAYHGGGPLPDQERAADNEAPEQEADALLARINRDLDTEELLTQHLLRRHGVSA